MSVCARSGRLERVLFALAGSLSLVGVVLALTVSPWFLAVTVFVAANQWLFALAGDCPASLVLRRLGLAGASDA